MRREAVDARRRVADDVDVVGLLALKASIAAWVLHQGFTHVSDDDYARVVIAELFAFAPKLDPSSTSWLPLPFWLTGGAMMAFGRSLLVARAVAIVCGVISIVPVYLALRAAGMARWARWVAVALAMATPWNAWLGVATVPEAFVGALMATAAILLSRRDALFWASASVLVAGLSRYEAWPLCVAVALEAAVNAVDARRAGRRPVREALWIAVALAGPVLWLLWNLRAHGDALHFLQRVTSYRRRFEGAHLIPLSVRLFAFPRALVQGAPEIAVLSLLGASGLAIDPAARSRWLRPLGAVLLVMAFLVYGDLHDGAPTHHPERALLGVWWVLAACGVDGARSLLVRLSWARPKREAWAVGFGVAAALVWALGLPTLWRASPGRTENENRMAQISRGDELRSLHVKALTVVPCAYEHFALLAAFGAPERAEVRESQRSVVTDECPETLTQ